MSDLPFITVVMPVRNEERFILETLMQVLKQDYPQDRFEVIVADGMSEDKTPTIVEEISRNFPNVRLIRNEKRLSSAGRNVGFRNGKGEFFLVIDGHCYIPTDQLLNNVVICFEKSGADCLGRPQPLDPPGLTHFQQAVALARASWLGHGTDSLIYSDYEGYASPVSNGAAYKRTVFEKVGYIDESFDACEDVEFNFRVKKAGLTAYTSPKLKVKYYPRESIGKLFHQLVRYGRGRMLLAKKHSSSVTPSILIPPMFVLGIFSLLVVEILNISLTSLYTSIITGVAAKILLFIYVLYILAVILESISISTSHGIQLLIYLPMIFVCIHFALGYGYLKECIARNT